MNRKPADNSLNISLIQPDIIVQRKKHDHYSKRRTRLLAALLSVAIMFAIYLIVCSLNHTKEAATPDGEDVNRPWQNERLPHGIDVQKYRLFIYDVSFENFTFRGSISMYFTISNKLDYLIFHKKNLNIQSIRLFEADVRPIDSKREFEYQAKEFHIIEPINALRPGKYVLSVNYSGYTNIGKMGMYQSSYIEDGRTK
jgi:hypothetical protein